MRAQRGGGGGDPCSTRSQSHATARTARDAPAALAPITSIVQTSFFMGQRPSEMSARRARFHVGPVGAVDKIENGAAARARALVLTPRDTECVAFGFGRREESVHSRLRA